MAKLISVLRYRDPLMTIDWLSRILGFERHFVAEENGQIVHAQMRLGDALLMLGPDHADDRYGMHSPLALTGTSQCVYIVVDGNVDDAYVRASDAGAEIVTAP